MATTTISGSTVTFSNSGAAANLSQTGTEDGTLAFTFDVLAASGGGKNTTIYSVDDGAVDTVYSGTLSNNFKTYDTDLLFKDASVNSWQLGGDVSDRGAHVWIGTDGKIHYDAKNIADQFQQLAAGETTTDTIKYTIKMSNGTLSVGTLTVVITGTNDAAEITGSNTAALNETNAAQSTGGDLNATDVDSSDAFVAQTDVAGSNGFGTFSINADGVWTYTMNDAHDEFEGDTDYTDSITVATADGTEKIITVTMHGTNDAAEITGSNTAALNETNAAQSTGGDLNATDVDSSDAFVAQTDVAGSNGFGTFSINADGVWTYTMNDAHDEFEGDTDYTDSITVATADGTEKIITVTMHGTNDAAEITGSNTAALNETNAAQSTGGDLNATDVDSSDAFVAQTDVAGSNGFGTFSINADGVWTYTMNDAHDEFEGDTDYTDSITVATADGTEKIITVTMHGTNDAAEITGSNTAALNETNAAQSTGGDLNATDVDSSDAFVAQTDVAGSNGFGTFSINADGVWTYTMNDAHDEFEGDTDYTDSITVATADGTEKIITVTMHGTNDAAEITGSNTAALNETNAAQSTGGDLNATDVDSSDAFVAQTDVAGSNGFGTFSINADGVWTYTMNDAHDEFEGDTDYTDSITVATADGTEKIITVTMHGTNDAAEITGSNTAALNETNAAQSTGGDLNATDVDSSDAFVAQTDVAGSNGFGTFSINADGVWTYTMNDAHDEFEGDTDYTDSITVATADGTEKIITVTMHGTNDAAVADSDTSNDHDTDTATATTTDWGATAGTDTKVGDDADNTISGGNGKDTLYGAGGNDTLNGNVGVDEVYGQAGNDKLIGDNGEDTLYGGSGDDLLTGGGGADDLWGGSGNDTFVFKAANDSSSGALDTIHDFHHGFDTIDVTLINSGDGGTNDFAFGGTVATAHGVWYTEGDGNTTLHFDTNGSTGDEMTITLTGTNLGLTALDFDL